MFVFSFRRASPYVKVCQPFRLFLIGCLWLFYRTSVLEKVHFLKYASEFYSLLFFYEKRKHSFLFCQIPFFKGMTIFSDEVLYKTSAFLKDIIWRLFRTDWCLSFLFVGLHPTLRYFSLSGFSSLAVFGFFIELPF